MTTNMAGIHAKDDGSARIQQHDQIVRHMKQETDPEPERIQKVFRIVGGLESEKRYGVTTNIYQAQHMGSKMQVPGHERNVRAQV